MTVDRDLIRRATARCGGGRVHRTVQMTAAYEMAVVRANHARCPDRAEELDLAMRLEQSLRAMLAA